MGRKFKAVLPFGYTRTCVYCGDPASARDHFRCWRDFEIPWYVPACTWCNSTLGYNSHTTMSERCEHIRQSLYRKHHRLLNTNYEKLLRGSKGSLRQHLIYCRNNAKAVNARIAWASAMIAACDFELSKLVEGSVEAEILRVSIDRLLLAEERGRLLES